MGKIKKHRVVVDTNVFISAILFGGIPGEIITLWKNGRITPLLSKEILDEYIKVLTYPKFNLTEEEINYILHGEILPFFQAVVPKLGRKIINDDPSDDKFIHCAETGKAHTIISGDHHLLNLKTYQKIRVQSPSKFLADFRSFVFCD